MPSIHDIVLAELLESWSSPEEVARRIAAALAAAEPDVEPHLEQVVLLIDVAAADSTEAFWTVVRWVESQRESLRAIPGLSGFCTTTAAGVAGGGYLRP